MKSHNSAIALKVFIALAATALAAGAIALAYRAGCTHNAAGTTIEAADLQVASVWLMIPSLSMFAALFAAPASASLLRTAVRAVGFFFVAGPVALVVLIHTKGQGEQASNCGNRDRFPIIQKI